MPFLTSYRAIYCIAICMVVALWAVGRKRKFNPKRKKYASWDLGLNESLNLPSFFKEETFCGKMHHQHAMKKDKRKRINVGCLPIISKKERIQEVLDKRGEEVLVYDEKTKRFRRYKSNTPFMTTTTTTTTTKASEGEKELLKAIEDGLEEFVENAAEFCIGVTTFCRTSILSAMDKLVDVFGSLDMPSMFSSVQSTDQGKRPTLAETPSLQTSPAKGYVALDSQQTSDSGDSYSSPEHAPDPHLDGANDSQQQPDGPFEDQLANVTALCSSHTAEWEFLHDDEPSPSPSPSPSHTTDDEPGSQADVTASADPQLAPHDVAMQTREDPLVMLITSRSHPAQYILPKGGLHKGEAACCGALRECWEEAGVTGHCGALIRVDATAVTGLASSPEAVVPLAPPPPPPALADVALVKSMPDEDSKHRGIKKWYWFVIKAKKIADAYPELGQRQRVWLFLSDIDKFEPLRDDARSVINAWRKSLS